MLRFLRHFFLILVFACGHFVLMAFSILSTRDEIEMQEARERGKTISVFEHAFSWLGCILALPMVLVSLLLEKVNHALLEAIDSFLLLFNSLLWGAAIDLLVTRRAREK